MNRVMMRRPAYKNVPANQHKLENNCRNTYVASNILNTENGFEIQLAVPGINKENIRMSVKEDILIIEGKTAKDSREIKYNRKQFDFSNFIKRYELNDEIDQENIEASYKNGILSVQLVNKVRNEADLERKIEIK